MEIKIDKMTLEDLEKIKNNLEEDYDNFWNYNILCQELKNETSYYVVANDEQNQIVGFAGVQFILDEADITNIVTKKTSRNCGIGTKLLEELIKASKQKNIKNITLEVNENNIYALKLYKKLDFKEIGRRKKYYNGKDTAIIMELKI